MDDRTATQAVWNSAAETARVLSEERERVAEVRSRVVRGAVTPGEIITLLDSLDRVYARVECHILLQAAIGQTPAPLSWWSRLW